MLAHIIKIDLIPTGTEINVTAIQEIGKFYTGKADGYALIIPSLFRSETMITTPSITTRRRVYTW